MRSCGCSNCHRHNEFDAEAAYKRLNKKYTELAETVIQYMSEAKLKRSDRAKNASLMAEHLTAVIGGSPTGNFAECCFVQGSLACSGVLIHPRIALTAKHCGAVQFVGLNAFSISDPQAEPRFVLTSRSAQNSDLKVLILRDNAVTKPAVIARTQEINQANSLTVVGYGDSELGSGVKRALGNISIFHNSGNVDIDPATEFAAGGGACRGDSGGPAYITVGGIRKLAGLHSRSTGGDCQDGGIYTRVDVHLAFIRQVAQPFGINF